MRINVGNIWAMYKANNKNLTPMKIPFPLCQTHIPTFVYKHKPEIGPSGRRQVVHPQPQTPQGDSVAKSETLLLIILSIVWYKGGPWTLVQSVFQKKVRGQKHPWKVDNCRNSSPYIKHFISNKYWQHPVKDNQCTERAGHHSPCLSPSVNTNKTSGTPH